jgi:hypothetical protein
MKVSHPHPHEGGGHAKGPLGRLLRFLLRKERAADPPWEEEHLREATGHLGEDIPKVDEDIPKVDEHAKDPGEQPSTPDDENGIDRTLEESFPASDPPSWTKTHAGTPTRT